MSIKRKLTLMMMAISVAAVMLTVIAITTYLIYDMRQSKQYELGITAALTGDRNAAVLAFMDLERMGRNLDMFRLTPAILIACVYNKTGTLMSGYRAESTSILTCPEMADNITRNLPGMLTALEPVRQNGEDIGHVFLVSNTSEIDAYVYKILLISATTIFFVLAVMLGLTVYVQRTISGPILELANTVESITQNGDYTLEAKANYHDETGILARAFNAMLGEVRKRDKELVDANETLEQKVVVRTRELEHAKKKAEEASEVKSEFLRNISHEFRTPLHAIISFASYGIKEHGSATRADLKQYYELIQKGAERLTRLVNEVLDLAKFEHGEHKLALQQANMRELMTRASELMLPLLRDKGITLIGDVNQDAIEVSCEHDKIVQVITNLLGNAIKFTPSGARIFLKARMDAPGQVEVAVTDEGVGIPEEEKEMIFESFRQSSRTNTGAGGTGLGLAICRNIIRAHGGKIWAENNKSGPGATVMFVIPTRQQVPANAGKGVEAKNENAA